MSEVAAGAMKCTAPRTYMRMNSACCRMYRMYVPPGGPTVVNLPAPLAE